MMNRVHQVSLQVMVRQGEGMIVSEMDGEKVMLSIENGKYYNLGDIGGRIWELIDEPITMHQIINILTSIYQVDRSECEAQVVSFLDHLLREGLIHMGD
jgi:hypothetical protein